MKHGAEHAIKDHSMKEEDFTLEFKEKIRGVNAVHTGVNLVRC
jgi:hypothetical protein